MSKNFGSRNAPKKETEQPARVSKEEKEKILSIRVAADVHVDLKQSALNQGKSLKDVMNEAFVLYLEKHPIKK